MTELIQPPHESSQQSRQAAEPAFEERLRPRLRPKVLPAGYQEWRRLLFVHWPVVVDALRPLVPGSMEIDTFDGQAYVSLVPFFVQAARPFGAPPTSGLVFQETNVRTYVHVAGREPGVYFFSLDAASLIATIGARVALGLPYFWADSREHLSQSGVQYAIHRLTGRRPFCRTAYHPGDPLGAAEPGTLDNFLIERYLLHVQRGSTLWTVKVHHQPYPLHQVRLEALEDQLLGAAGIYVANETTLMHYSPGVDVEIFPPRVRVAPPRGR